MEFGRPRFIQMKKKKKMNRDKKFKNQFALRLYIVCKTFSMESIIEIWSKTI